MANNQEQNQVPIPVAAFVPNIPRSTLTLIDAAIGIVTLEVQMAMLGHAQNRNVMAILAYLLGLLLLISVYCTLYRFWMGFGACGNPHFWGNVFPCGIPVALTVMVVVHLLQYNESMHSTLATNVTSIVVTSVCAGLVFSSAAISVLLRMR